MPSNPAHVIRIPNAVRHRERLFFQGEYQKLQEAARRCKKPILLPAILSAPETAIRRSELLSLRQVGTDLNRRMTIQPNANNSTRREVPLTNTEIKIIRKPLDR